MKTIQTVFVISIAALSANASTIQFASSATAVDSTQNNSVGNNIVISKNPGWVDPITGSNWISFSNTGDPSTPGFNAPANGTVVSFFQHFTLTAADLSTNGTVSLYADDSAATVLNGHTLMSEASGAGNTYSTCSDTKPNCTSLTTIALPAQYLVLGLNTLQFDVAQRAGSSFGLDYAGVVGASTGGGTPTATPEPATWALMGSGFLLLGVKLRKLHVDKSRG